MDEQRIDQIERHLDRDDVDPAVWRHEARELLAEVRRLRQQERERRENFPARLAAAAWRAERR
jgi:hypothetical protein